MSLRNRLDKFKTNRPHGEQENMDENAVRVILNDELKTFYKEQVLPLDKVNGDRISGLENALRDLKGVIKGVGICMSIPGLLYTVLGIVKLVKNTH